MTNKIGLLVDEGADLPGEIIEKYQIRVIPFKMDWPELENFSGQNTFQKMRELEKRGIESFGKTSQPSPKDFLEAFKKQLELFEKIICITITSKLSGTYNSAIQAKNYLTPEQAERVFVVDSLNVSCGQGLLVFKALDLIENGKDAREIARELEKLSLGIYLYGIIEDPKWLEASGRIPHQLANWVRRMQKIGIRPMLGIENGSLEAVSIKTKAKNVPATLFNHFKIKTQKLREQRKKIRVAITHGDNLAGAQKLKEMIEKELGGVEVVFLNLVDNVLGIIGGPGVLVMAWSEI